MYTYPVSCTTDLTMLWHSFMLNKRTVKWKAYYVNFINLDSWYFFFFVAHQTDTRFDSRKKEIGEIAHWAEGEVWYNCHGERKERKSYSRLKGRNQS